MIYDLTIRQFTKSHFGFKKSLAVAHTDLAHTNDDVEEVIRAGIIKNFEVAYGQSWKFIQRWLRENVAYEETELLRTRKELFRTARQYGLIDDPEVWFEYGDARNMTSHTCDEEKAVFVF